MTPSTTRHESLLLLDGARLVADELAAVVVFLGGVDEVGSRVEDIMQGEGRVAAIPGREGVAVEVVPVGAVGGEREGCECVLEGFWRRRHDDVIFGRMVLR